MHAARPTPTPMTKRPPIIAGTVCETAWAVAPAMKMMSAMPRTHLRPMMSLRTPATRPPRRAPRVVAEVMNSYKGGTLSSCWTITGFEKVPRGSCCRLPEPICHLRRLKGSYLVNPKHQGSKFHVAACSTRLLRLLRLTFCVFESSAGPKSPPIVTRAPEMTPVSYWSTSQKDIPILIGSMEGSHQTEGRRYCSQ